MTNNLEAVREIPWDVHVIVAGLSNSNNNSTVPLHECFSLCDIFQIEAEDGKCVPSDTLLLEYKY